MEARLSSLQILCVLTVVPGLTDPALAKTSREREAVVVTLGGLEIEIIRNASCCGRCGEPSHLDHACFQTCYCDNHCLLYQDCCLDYELYCTDLEQRLVQLGGVDQLLETLGRCTDLSVTPPTTPTEESMCPVWGSTEQSGSYTREYVCKIEALWIPVILARNSNTSLTHVHVRAGKNSEYLLIQGCQEGVHEKELTELCLSDDSSRFETLKDIQKVTPVTASDGLHYRNAFCAKCHGFGDEDVQFWQVELKCPDEVMLTGLTDSSVSSCGNFSVVPPSIFKWEAVQPRVVPAGEVSHACCVGSTSEATCSVYRMQTRCAKNPHCDWCGSCSCPKSGLSFEGPLRFLPISALFEFASHRELQFSLENQPPVLVCDQDEYFDIFLRACRRFYCPSGQALGPLGTCIAKDINPCLLSDQIECELISFEVDLRSEIKNLDLVRSQMLNFTEALLDLTITSSYSSDCEESHSFLRCKLAVVTASPQSFAQTFSSYIARMKAFGPLYDEDSSLVIEKLTLKNFDGRGFLVKKCGRLGQTPVGYSLGTDFSKFENNNTLFVNIKVRNGSVTCPSERTFQEVVFIPSGRNIDTKEIVYQCELKLNCSLIILNSSELIWVDNETWLLTSGGNISADEVIWLSDEEAVVCRPPSRGVSAQGSLRDDAVLSVVCLVVSQLFLLLSLLNFCVFPELCTLPGKNLFCFIAALFLTQMVFLIGPGSPLKGLVITNEGSCLTFAVLLNYLVLTTFFWSNVVSLHLARTFGFRLRMRDERFGHAFLWYSLYGWGAPFLISVTGCVLHHLLVVDRERVALYHTKYCIPSGFGLLFLVAMPASLLMVSNAVFFVLTVIGIRRTRRSTSIVKKQRGQLERLQSEVTLCIKIFVVTGMTWFLIFILGHFDVVGFSYIFIVLLSAQGPLLFFSFALTERVRNMWRARLKRLCKRRDRFPKDSIVSSVSRDISSGRTSGESLRVDDKAMLLEDKTTGVAAHVQTEHEL